MTHHTVPDLLPGTLTCSFFGRCKRHRCTAGRSRSVCSRSEDVLQIDQGSLYPALHRLEHKGWIEAEWAVSELGRRAKYYELTPAGRRQLTVEAGEWERMSTAIGRVLKLA